MSVKTRIGTYARTWGIRTESGFRAVAPTRIRGWLARRSVTDGGDRLLVAPGLQVIGRGTLLMGADVSLRHRVRLMFEGTGGGTIQLGDRVFVNDRTEIRCESRIGIGADSLLSFDVIVMDTDFHQLDDAQRVAPVAIGEHVWIGARALILKGVTIGDGAVVAAGALVNKDVPPRALVAGVPARVVRENVSWSIFAGAFHCDGPRAARRPARSDDRALASTQSRTFDGLMRLIVARRSAIDTGRLDTVLPEALRLII